MNVDVRHTRHQVARGSRADLDRDGKFVLYKNVAKLKATYQIRLLLSRALEMGRKLVIRVPVRCEIQRDLLALRREHPAVLLVERV